MTKTIKTQSFLLRSLAYLACISQLSAQPTSNSSENPKIRVAFLGAFSGPDPNTSKELFRGIKIFLETVPAAKAKLEIESFDNSGEIDQTVLMMREIRKQNYRIVLGLASSNEAIAAAKVAMAEKMLFITPFATSTLVTQNNPYVFRSCFSDDFQGITLAHFAQQHLKAKKILILRNIDSQYSIGLAERFQKSLVSSITESHRLDYAKETIDSEAIFREVKKFSPDFIFIPDHITRAALISKRINRDLPKIQFLGSDGFGGKKMFMNVMQSPPQMTLYYSTHWSEEIKSRANLKFMSVYQKVFPGEDPSSGAALGYDMMLSLWSALQKNQFRSDPETLIPVLETISYQSTVGVVKYPLTSDHSPSKPIVIIKYQNGQSKMDRVYHP